MLQLDRLRIVQGDFTLTADLQVPGGVCVAVMGASGDGKSTLLAAIAGFLEPATGRVVWDGEDITGRAPAKRPIAMLFQDQNLFPHLTVQQNLMLVLRQRGRATEAERARVAEALAHVGLTGLEARKPGALSGGQQSRVAVARVLLQDKPLWLLDEPFAALGPALKQEMLDLVAREAADRGATVLMVSHDPADAARIAPLCLLVAEGAVTGPEDTRSVLADPPPALRRYLGG